MQKEIDLLVQKTRVALGDLPDIDGEDILGLREEDVSLDIKAKRRGPVRRTISPLNVKSDNVLPASDVGARIEPTLSNKSDRFARVETPPSAVGTDAEVSTLLQVHDMLLGVHARDRWVEKLVQTVRDICGGGKDLSVQSGVGNNTMKENETDVGSASKPQNGCEVSDHELPVNRESTLVCHSVQDNNYVEECVCVGCGTMHLCISCF